MPNWKFSVSDLFVANLWTGWRLRLAWLICLIVILLLGLIRLETAPPFTYMSFSLLPLLFLFITWIDGKWNGLIVAFFAAAMWLLGDLASERHFGILWIPWVNAATFLMIYVLMVLVFYQIRLQFQREHELASQDALTGLKNREAFLEAGALEVGRSKRYAHSLGVVFLDLDDFKRLNDTKGHDVGDMALHVTAKALLGAIRSSDLVARLGGDEFAVLLPEIGYDEAAEAGHRIFLTVNNALRDFPPVKGSIGLAWFEEADRTFPSMLKAADGLMYEVKQSGKNDLRLRSFATMR